MRKKYQFRADPGLEIRLQALADKRQSTPAETARLAMEVGLLALEAEGKINDLRLALVTESILVMVDIIGQHIAPKQIEEAPELALARMAKYHAAL